MAKIIKYKFLSCEVNHGSEENPDIEQIFLDAEIMCKTKAQYDANYPIAEMEAIPGSIEVSGEFDSDPETEPTPTLEDRVATVESDVASLTAAIEKGLSL